MPTSKPPLTGRGSGMSFSKQDKYQKDSLAKSQGKFMTTFSRSKTSEIVTTWNDVHYTTFMQAGFLFLGDASGAVDTATVPMAETTSLLDAAWRNYFTNANLKDVVATDETSWELYTAVACQIAIDFQLMHITRVLLPAYTESNTQPGNVTAYLSYFDQDAWDTLVNSFKDFPFPAIAIEFANIFASWIVQISPEYEKHTIRIPPAYFVPFKAQYDLEDYEAMRSLLRVNLGGFITHSKKYGLKNGTMPTLKAPVIKTLSDPDVIAYFNHAYFGWYDNQPATQAVNPNGGFGGANLTTEYTGVEYFFKDTPNESKIHLFGPWFGIGDATNNPYGGQISHGAAAAAEYRLNMSCCAQHGAALDPTQTLVTSGHIIQLFKAYWDSNSAVFKPLLSGTNFTASQNIGQTWPLALHNNCFIGTNRRATPTNNDLLNFVGRSCV